MPGPRAGRRRLRRPGQPFFRHRRLPRQTSSLAICRVPAPSRANRLRLPTPPWTICWPVSSVPRWRTRRRRRPGSPLKPLRLPALFSSVSRRRHHRASRLTTCRAIARSAGRLRRPDSLPGTWQSSRSKLLRSRPRLPDSPLKPLRLPPLPSSGNRLRHPRASRWTTCRATARSAGRLRRPDSPRKTSRARARSGARPTDRPLPLRDSRRTRTLIPSRARRSSRLPFSGRAVRTRRPAKSAPGPRRRRPGSPPPTSPGRTRSAPGPPRLRRPGSPPPTSPGKTRSAQGPPRPRPPDSPRHRKRQRQPLSPSPSRSSHPTSLPVPVGPTRSAERGVARQQGHGGPVTVTPGIPRRRAAQLPRAGRRQGPDRPPDFSQRATCSMVMVRSADLHMS